MSAVGSIRAARRGLGLREQDGQGQKPIHFRASRAGLCKEWRAHCQSSACSAIVAVWPGIVQPSCEGRHNGSHLPVLGPATRRAFASSRAGVGSSESPPPLPPPRSSLTRFCDIFLKAVFKCTVQCAFKGHSHCGIAATTICL